MEHSAGSVGARRLGRSWGPCSAGRSRAAGTGCSFHTGAIFALQPGGRPGIIAIGAGGRAWRLASLPGTLTPTGITFDATGRFRHALLVTAHGHAGTAVLAIGCTGRVRAITAHAPAMEGGIAVAPASFGRYGGDLVAAGETSGRIIAVAPDGTVVTLAASGLPCDSGRQDVCHFPTRAAPIGG